MKYHRILTKKGNLTLIQDFYKNGNLQMEGLAYDINPENEIFHGQVTWFYENGEISEIKNYKNGILNGISKRFDEQSRIIQDLIFEDNENYSGKEFGYKDLENDILFNKITEYKNINSYKTIFFEQDINSVRYEIIYKNNLTEYKYFGNNGEYIGGFIEENLKNNDVEVAYFSNPMKIAYIKKFIIENQIPVKDEEIWYYKNGKIHQKYKKNNNEALLITYDLNENKIGKLFYKFNSLYNELNPYEGEKYEYNFAPEKDRTLEIINTYKNGEIIKTKQFNEQENNLFSETDFLENLIIKEIKFYNPNGTVKNILTYKEGIPYNGNYYEDNLEENYINGTLKESKIYWENKKLKKHKEFIIDKNIYESKFYDENQNILYSYTKINDNQPNISGDFIIYENNKPISTAVIKNGLLQSGKIRFERFELIEEQQRKGNYIYFKTYNLAGTLIEESKILIENKYNPDLLIDESLFI